MKQLALSCLMLLAACHEGEQRGTRDQKVDPIIGCWKVVRDPTGAVPNPQAIIQFSRSDQDGSKLTGADRWFGNENTKWTRESKFLISLSNPPETVQATVVEIDTSSKTLDLDWRELGTIKNLHSTSCEELDDGGI